MARVLPGVVDAMELSQTHFNLPDPLVAGLTGYQILTIKANRSKRGWEIGSLVDPGDSVWRKRVVEEDGRIAIVTDPPAGEPEIIEEQDEITPEEFIEAVEALKLRLHKQIILLLRSGDQIHWPGLERIEGDVQNLQKLMEMQGATHSAAPEPPKPEEIAEVLRKLEERIHELAEQRYLELVAKRLDGQGTVPGGAGMDGAGENQTLTV